MSSALVCSDALGFEDSLYLLHERQSHARCSSFREGKMIAVLGKIDEIKSIIKSANNNGVCEIANDNAEGQVIISGSKKGVENFEKKFKR